jgi:hypothetical protein
MLQRRNHYCHWYYYYIHYPTHRHRKDRPIIFIAALDHLDRTFPKFNNRSNDGYSADWTGSDNGWTKLAPLGAWPKDEGGVQQGEQREEGHEGEEHVRWTGGSDTGIAESEAAAKAEGQHSIGYCHYICSVDSIGYH